MTREADLCGDRLRLSAFLRVVDGMPQRPTRLRRRLVESSHHLDSLSQGDSGLTDARSLSDQESALGQYPKILDVVRSPVLQTPELAAKDRQSAHQIGTKPQSDCSQREAGQHAGVKKRSAKRSTNSTPTKPSQKPRRISSTRKRRQLPVDELALLRTTSSDGLPLPSVRKF